MRIFNSFNTKPLPKLTDKINNIMWKSTTGHNIINDAPENDDSWDTDPDYINDVSEETQRWGNQGMSHLVFFIFHCD